MPSRRVFLLRAAQVGGIVMGAGLLGACSSGASAPAQPTAAPAPTSAAPPAAPTQSAPAPQAAPTQASAAAAKSLVIGLISDPRNFDPATTTGTQGREATRAFFDPLINIDPQTGKYTPGLAESWDQPDAKTYVLHLKQGVKFHDGTPFDAEAVKAHFDFHLNPDNKSLRLTEINLIDSVTAVDPQTVRIALKSPFAAFLAPLFDLSGFIESPTARQKYGQDFGLHPVGTGPFRLVEYSKDAQTVLERNPDYWLPGQPKVDRVVLRPIPVPATRMTELVTGGIVIAPEPPFQDLQKLKADQTVVLSEKPGFRWDYMAFNVTKDIANNKLFRQAVNYAIDRDAIQNVAYLGTGSPAWDPILPGSPFFDANYKPIARDVGKAKQLIQQSGVQMPVSFEVAISQDLVKQQVVQITQQSLAEVGITLTIKQMDAAAHTTRVGTGDYVFDVAWGWSGYRPDPDQYMSTSLNSKSPGGLNIARYNQPKVDELLAQEKAASTEDARRAAFRQMADVLTDDAVYISYHYGSDFKVLRPEVKGFVHRQDGLLRYQELSLA